jgi:hypothetical protein
MLKSESRFLVADRIWIATARLHQQMPLRASFKKAEILQTLEAEGMAEEVERGTLNAHLDQHCVANVPPSSGKYRMLYEATPGNLRLFRPGDMTHPARIQKRKPSKTTPKREEIPPQYRQLLDWYDNWSKETHTNSGFNWEDDPLIRLIGSGKHIWADEHADQYVENLRREEPA